MTIAASFRGPERRLSAWGKILRFNWALAILIVASPQSAS